MTDDDPTPPRRPWRTDAEWLALVERVGAAELSKLDHERTVRSWKWVAAAAGIILLAGGYLGGVSRWQKRQPAFAMVATVPGQRVVVHLPDSSTITLGPASRLRYDRLGRSREITLDGLADFHVKHDVDRPFVVHASQAVVTDIGTEFVVRAYSSDSTAHVAVQSGIVSVANRNGDRGRLTLHAGEVALVHGTSAPLAVHETNPASLTAWVTGTLTFDDEFLSDVVRELGRWFDVDIRLADPTLANRHVTAVYNLPALTSVLDALGATLGLRYEKTGRVVTLRPR